MYKYIYIYICVIYILYIAAICMTFLYYLPHSDLLFVYVWRWTLLQIASTWHFCWVELLCEPGQRPATSPGIRDRSFRRATPSASWGDWLCTGARSEQKPWIYHEYPINIYIYIYISLSQSIRWRLIGSMSYHVFSWTEDLGSPWRYRGVHGKRRIPGGGIMGCSAHPEGSK